MNVANLAAILLSGDEGHGGDDGDDARDLHFDCEVFGLERKFLSETIEIGFRCEVFERLTCDGKRTEYPAHLVEYLYLVVDGHDIPMAHRQTV